MSVLWLVGWDRVRVGGGGEKQKYHHAKPVVSTLAIKPPTSPQGCIIKTAGGGDRRAVGWGKREDLGGPGTIKKKKAIQIERQIFIR